MTSVDEILERLQRLETEVRELKTGKSLADKALEFERLPGDATVGKDYVAYRFGCSENWVVRREGGTHLCRRISNKPLKFIKSEVDAAWRKYSQPAKEKAAAYSVSANVRRR